MEKDSFIDLDFTKPKSRKFFQSDIKTFLIPNQSLEEDNIIDDKELLIKDIKKFSLNKSNIINLLKEEKDEIKSKKYKKETQPAAIKTFCRIRPTDNLNGNFNLLIFSFEKILKLIFLILLYSTIYNK